MNPITTTIDLDYALRQAVANQNIGTLQKLHNSYRVQSGAVNRLKLVNIAAQNGALDIVHYLINSIGADRDNKGTNGVTPLMEAVKNNHIKIVKYLLNKGAQINQTGGFPVRTALHYAAEKGYEDIVEELLVKGADVGAEGVCGTRPLALALQNKHIESARRLRQKKREVVEKFQKDDGYALLNAASKGNKEVVDFLIESKINLDFQNKEGKTPLMEAAENGHGEIVDMLIKEDAALELVDEKGKTALGYAVEKKDLTITEALINAGATVLSEGRNIFDLQEIELAPTEFDYEFAKLVSNVNPGLRLRR